MQMQRHGDHVRGTINTTQIACCAPIPARLMQKRDTFSGVISGSELVLRLSTGVTWKGALSPSGVSIRSSDKAPLAIRFRPASSADYDAAAAKTKASLH